MPEYDSSADVILGRGATYVTFLAPSGGDDAPIINAALLASQMVLLRDPNHLEFKLISAPVVTNSYNTLFIDDCTVRRLPDGNGVATTNTQLITNASARTLNGSSAAGAVPDRRIRITGRGDARLIGQTSAYIMAAVAAGDTMMQLSEALPNGTYQWGDNVSGTSEVITVTNGNSTGATAAPYTATLAAAITTAHAFSSTSRIGITDQNRHYTDSSQTIWSNIGIAWVNVEDVEVSGVEIGPCRAFAANTQASTDVRWRNIRLAQDGSSVNQDGIDVGPGSTNIHMDGIKGTTGDDVFSIYGQNTSASIHPWVSAKLTAAQRDILGVYISDVKVQVVQTGDVFRFQAGDGSRCRRIFIHNVTNYGTTAHPVALFGSTQWVTTPPSMTDMGEIVIDGYEGPFSTFIAADSNFQDVTVRHVKAVSSYGKLLGPASPVAGFTPQVRMIRFEDIHLPISTGSLTSGLGYLFAGSVGTFTDCSFEGVFAQALRGITKPSGTAALVNAKFRSVHAMVVMEALFNEVVASTGRAEDVMVDGYDTGTHPTFAGTPTALRFSGAIPALTSADVAPAPTVGSVLLGDGTIALDGAVSKHPGFWRADGAQWVADAAGALGFPYTVDPGIIRTNTTDALGVAANGAIFARAMEAGTVNAIGMHVMTSSGNICVGVYRNTGSGRSAAPGALLASSGSVACPATGYAAIPLSSTIYVHKGDWIALAADNATATVKALLGTAIGTELGAGRQGTASAVFPLPPTAPAITHTVGNTHVLIGTNV